MKKSPVSPVRLHDIIAEHPTPFYLYDEATIRRQVQNLQQAFAWNKGFREYFAVKALPNPAILSLLRSLGCGADCASLTELILADRAGISGQNIMLTSNNTPAEEFVMASELGAIINLDAVTLIDFLEDTVGIPETVCCRYTPDHEVGASNTIMGQTGQSKFGMTKPQLFEAFRVLQAKGATQFGIHCMAASNSLSQTYYPELARELFGLALEIQDELGISVSFLNFAGGLGIPYLPSETPLDLAVIGAEVQALYQEMLSPAGLAPAIFTELGRYITGPAGYLVTTVRHMKNTYKEYVGVDASAVNLLRPAMYGAYHHVSVVGKDDVAADHVYDVVGSLCENNDKFAIDRALPEISPGDVVLIHDAGAHSFSMGYNYNGKLRSAELLLGEDGSVRLIRRAETPADYFATLDV